MGNSVPVIGFQGGISWLAEKPSRFEPVALFGSHIVNDSDLKSAIPALLHQSFRCP
jgi:hypothetical protein